MSRPVTIDSELFDIDSFRGGGRQVFKFVFDSTIHRLQGYTRKHFKFIPDVDREEIIADAYYKLFLHRERIREYDHAVYYLILCVKRACIHFENKTQKRKKFESELRYMLHEFEPLESNYHDLLKNAIAALSPKQKRIMEAFVYDQMYTSEVALLTGTTKQTVLNVKNAAIKNIFHLLKISYEENVHTLYLTVPVKS